MSAPRATDALLHWLPFSVPQWCYGWNLFTGLLFRIGFRNKVAVLLQGTYSASSEAVHHYRIGTLNTPASPEAANRRTDCLPDGEN